MSSFQNISDEISALVPFEIFDYYDGPRFYSCKDRVGQLFLVYWIDEVANESRWLYQRVSHDRYLAMKAGKISVAWVFSNPEDETIYVVSGTSSGFTVGQLAPENLDPAWLPPTDLFLEIAASALPIKLTSTQEKAKASNRDVFDIAFERLANSSEIGCGKLGRALEALQNTIYSFTASMHGDAKRVTEEIKVSSELLITGVFQSSFGVRLESKQTDLVGDNEPEKAARALVDLLRETAVPENVAMALKKHSVLARSRFKHFLGVVVEAGLTVKTEWATPRSSSIESRSPYADLVATLNKLNETDEATKQISTYAGKLVGVDIESDFFALRILDTGGLIKGKLAKNLESQHFEVPSQVVATIEEACVIDPLTEKEKWTNTLLRLEERSAK
jgi:hypothetical protein